MDWIYAALIMLGLIRQAPAQYHAPVKTLPLIVPAPPPVHAQFVWGPQCGSTN